MIIEYFTNGAFVVDNTTCANDHFSLARHNSDNHSIEFKANAVVDGHTMLLTHMQVTRYGKARFKDWSDGSARKLWMANYFCRVEEAVKKQLSKRNYKGAVKLRIKGSWAQHDFLTNRGYSVVSDTRSYEDGYYTNIYEKTL